MAQHDCQITHDERMLGRPWKIECSCGFCGAAESEVEAERVMASHKILEGQKEKLRERGFLK